MENRMEELITFSNIFEFHFELDAPVLNYSIDFLLAQPDSM